MRKHKRRVQSMFATSTVNYMGFKTYVWTLISDKPLPRKV